MFNPVNCIVMTRLSISLVIALISLSVYAHAQDSGALRMVRMSFSSAESNYKAGNYEQALQEFKIVVNTVPVSVDSRRYLEMRLDAILYIIDIYFYKHVNLSQGCEFLNLYLEDMNAIRRGEVLRAGQRLEYFSKEQEFIANYVRRCENYQKTDEDMDNFRRRFEEEF